MKYQQQRGRLWGLCETASARFCKLHSEFENRRIRAAVHRGDMKTAERLLGPEEGRALSWSITIGLALFELKRTAQLRRCQAAIEQAYAGERLLADKEPDENAGSILYEAIETVIAARQPWRVLRMAERIARKGGNDERAVALLAARIADAHSVALAADLRELNPNAAGPVQIIALSLEELRRNDETPPANEPRGIKEDDKHAVETLHKAWDLITGIGETCRIGHGPPAPAEPADRRLGPRASLARRLDRLGRQRLREPLDGPTRVPARPRA